MSPVFGAQERILEFVENGAGTYTGDVQLPPRAIITEILIVNAAVWNSAGTASLDIGDYTAAGVALDADGFYASVNLKATDVPAGEAVGLGFRGASGVAGAYFDGTAVTWEGLYSASARILRAVVTVASGSGTAGRTFVVVKYNVPDRSYAARKITR